MLRSGSESMNRTINVKPELNLASSLGIQCEGGEWTVLNQFELSFNCWFTLSGNLTSYQCTASVVIAIPWSASKQQWHHLSILHVSKDGHIVFVFCLFTLNPNTIKYSVLQLICRSEVKRAPNALTNYNVVVFTCCPALTCGADDSPGFWDLVWWLGIWWWWCCSAKRPL